MTNDGLSRHSTKFYEMELLYDSDKAADWQS